MALFVKAKRVSPIYHVFGKRKGSARQTEGVERLRAASPSELNFVFDGLNTGIKLKAYSDDNGKGSLRHFIKNLDSSKGAIVQIQKPGMTIHHSVMVDHLKVKDGQGYVFVVDSAGDSGYWKWNDFQKVSGLYPASSNTDAPKFSGYYQFPE